MEKFKYQQTSIVGLLHYSVILLFMIFCTSRVNGEERAKALVDVQQSIPDLQKGIYVVVGTFQIRENAQHYAKSIKIPGTTPKLGRYSENGLFYVYAFFTSGDLDVARSKRSELRATKQFYDAWLLYVGLKLEDLLPKEETPDVVVMNQPKEMKTGDLALEKSKAADMIPPPPVKEDENLYNYRFSVINATTLKEVPGYVTIIDAQRNRAMKSVSTNQIHQLEAPTTQSKEIIAMCDIFGFVKEQAKFRIDNPMSSEDKAMIEESGGVTTIKFVLARHKVGEVLTMYNVYFYNNAAIMKPESKFELNSLLDMLKENDKLQIKIHGHTNGNAAGKIIRLREDDNNYFEVTPNNIEGFGSAKELSKARADVIARWLVEQGVDTKRMDIRGWGGKKMIYKKTDSMAGKNVRVEIELLKG